MPISNEAVGQRLIALEKRNEQLAMLVSLLARQVAWAAHETQAVRAALEKEATPAVLADDLSTTLLSVRSG